jgi:hypothetical protein
VRWTWHWFSGEADQPEDTVDLTEMKAEARAALKRSSAALADARKRDPEVRGLGEALRRARQKNNFAGRIAQTFREAG